MRPAKMTVIFICFYPACKVLEQ